MNKIFLFLFYLIAHLSYAQKVSLTGSLIDPDANPLSSATVMLLNRADSSIVNFTVSDGRGFFGLKNLSKGEYQLKITFVGFQTFVENIDINESDIQTGNIAMRIATKELEELVVAGEKVPVTVKQDTIEFNAGSFKTRANASVEDLLKKLPGLEVDNDGTVKAQGENVQRVTVDGREFFGRDPKLATRNLPANAIDKVQVFDKKSDQTEFTGIDDGQREKTINLELKEENRNGAFGNVTAGGGTADRFESKASVNRFTKTRQLSFLGMANNVNEQGFSLDDYMNFSGSSQQMMGGGGMRIEINDNNMNGVPLSTGDNQNGITSNYAGGLNLNSNFGTKTKLGGSYFFNHIDQDVSNSLNRINYLPTGNYTFNQTSRQKNTSNNHRLNVIVDQRIDSANSIKLNASISSLNSRSNILSQSQTLDANGTLQNESDRATIMDGAGINLNSNLLFRHKFPKKGRSFSVNTSLVINDFDNAGSVGSLNQFYVGTSETENISQSNTQVNEALSYAVTSSYTEPLGGRKYLEVNYSYGVNANDVNRSVWDESGTLQTFDSLLSNKYVSKYIFNRPGLNLRLIRQKFNVSLGVAWQSTQLNGDLIYQETAINRSFDNVLPTMRFNYDFSNFKHFSLDYETAMQEPNIQDLQPVVNNNDPLNLVLGNPELQPGYSHQLRGIFTLFDPGTFINFFSFVNATYTTDAISSSQEVDENLVRTTKPVNVKNNYSMDATIHFGFPLKKIKSRVGIRTSAVTSNGITLLNNVENSIQRATLGGMIRYSFSLDDVYNLDLSASIEEQRSEYQFDVQDQLFVNKTYEAESNLKMLKNYQFNAQFQFMDYRSKTTEFSQAIPFLNVSFSRFLLKNKGEFKVGVNNLLDKSINITQTTNTNYLEQRTSNNIGRFFMMSFTYALNKQLNPMAGTRGHMIRR
jgi:hypothetical protein